VLTRKNINYSSSALLHLSAEKFIDHVVVVELSVVRPKLRLQPVFHRFRRDFLDLLAKPMALQRAVLRLLGNLAVPFRTPKKSLVKPTHRLAAIKPQLIVADVA